jgi:undecaprenyl-diphosphatase
MNLVQALIIGIIQGLTEFIPISSSAHMILTERVLRLDQELSPEAITAFNAVCNWVRSSPLCSISCLTF